MFCKELRIVLHAQSENTKTCGTIVGNMTLVLIHDFCVRLQI